MCAGLVVKLAEQDELTLPVPQRYMASLKSFFPDHAAGWMHNNVFFTPAEHAADIWPVANDRSKKCIRLGRYAGMNGSVHNNVRELYYLHAGVDPSVRWTHNPLPDAAKFIEQVAIPNGDYIFIHDDPARGFNIKLDYFKAPYIRPDRGDEHLSILRYADALINAREIHVIDSSFFHLAESLPIKGKVFLHFYARPESVIYKGYRHPLQVIS